MKPASEKYCFNVKISQAQTFINNNLESKIDLNMIAKEVGISRFHFIRIFKAYLGETPFEYLRRKKILRSFKHLESTKNITEIALNLGFETPSSFNKAFKKITLLTPTEFRNLGKEQIDAIRYSLSQASKLKEIQMQLNMTNDYKIITREKRDIFSLEIRGENFSEIGSQVWDRFLKILAKEQQDLSESEFIGIGYINQDSKEEDSHVYKAAITAPSHKNITFEKLQSESLKEMKYARFLLQGSYQGLWVAFENAVKIIHESEHEIADEPCIENYLNDPSETPEDELLTEVLVPIQ